MPTYRGVSASKIRSLEKGASRKNRLIKEYKSTGFALGNGTLFLAGAAGGGVTRAYMPLIGQLPSDIGLGLVLATAGATMKQPKLIYFSMGILSGWVGGYAQEATERYLYGQGSVAVPETAVSGG